MMKYVLLFFIVGAIAALGYGGACTRSNDTEPSGSSAWGPNAPSSLTATAISSYQVRLNWLDNSDNETTFKIERKTGITGTYEIISTVPANTTSFLNNGLRAATGYYYRIRGWDYSLGFGPYSNEAGSTTLPPPNPPSNLALRVVTTSAINITWTDSSNDEDGFKIERKTGSSGNYLEIAMVPANITLYGNSGLSPATAYYYRVQAYNLGGSGSYSGEAQASTIVTIPNSPAALTATGISGSANQLSWTDSSDNEDGFTIERSTNDTSGFATLITVTGNTTTYQDTGLVSSTAYYYRVRAYNDAGLSLPSATAGGATRVWTQHIGTPGRDCAYGITADPDGNIYAAGFTTGSLDGNTNQGAEDIFVVKYNATGIRQWIRQAGTAASDLATKVAVDTNRNVYLTGYTYGNLDGNSNQGIMDCFLIKYDPNGVKLWSRQFGTSGGDLAECAQVDNSGNIYITGSTYGSFPGHSNQGDADIFLAKYDSAGAFQWARQFGSPSADTGYGIAIDAASNIVICGKTGGALDGNTNKGPANTDDLFLAKYDASGSRQWIKQEGTDGNDSAYAIALDANGNIYLSGNTTGDMEPLISQGGTDIFIIKYNSAYVKQWVKQIGSGVNDIAYGMALDSSGDVYITGTTDGEFDNSILAGDTDYFLVRYDPTGAKAWSRQNGTMADDIARDIVIPPGRDWIYIPVFSFGQIDNTNNEGNDDIFLIKYDLDGVKE